MDKKWSRDSPEALDIIKRAYAPKTVKFGNSVKHKITQLDEEDLNEIEKQYESISNAERETGPGG